MAIIIIIILKQYTQTNSTKNQSMETGEPEANSWVTIVIE